MKYDLSLGFTLDYSAAEAPSFFTLVVVSPNSDVSVSDIVALSLFLPAFTLASLDIKPTLAPGLLTELDNEIN